MEPLEEHTNSNHVCINHSLPSCTTVSSSEATHGATSNLAVSEIFGLENIPNGLFSL